MNPNDIINRIGRYHFLAACAAAVRLAPGTGTELDARGFDSDLPHEISDDIWDESRDQLDNLRLAFWFYERMPCYGHLFYIAVKFPYLREPSRAFLWETFRGYLNADSALADPVAYSLWCDYFEAAEPLAEEAWANLTMEPAGEKLLQRILIVSGPVSFHAKQRLYRQLLPQPSWHYYIFRSLLQSRFDVYGQIDTAIARQLLQQLALPEDTENFEKLRDSLK
ncbi:MAG: hypothetical protein AB7K24_05140 [Gemmataceae bacterium]